MSLHIVEHDAEIRYFDNRELPTARAWLENGSI
jgi:hypothetical protein